MVLRRRRLMRWRRGCRGWRGKLRMRLRKVKVWGVELGAEVGGVRESRMHLLRCTGRRRSQRLSTSSHQRTRVATAQRGGGRGHRHRGGGKQRGREGVVVARSRRGGGGRWRGRHGKRAGRRLDVGR